MPLPRASACKGVALIRAFGTIFSRFGSDEEKAAVRGWLTPLLKDPQIDF